MAEAGLEGFWLDWKCQGWGSVFPWFFLFAALVFFLVVVLAIVVVILVLGLRFFLVVFLMVVVLFVRVGFWILGGVVFGGVFGFGFFLGFALFFDVRAVLAEFLEFLGGAEFGEAFFEEIADGGFDLVFEAAVIGGGRAVRRFEASFGDAFEGFGGMERERGRVWGGRLGGLVAEGIELIAEGHELVLEGLELLVDVGVWAGGGGHAVGVRDGGERL
jgi:hypothetical protein